jgi:uncharacterized protein (DUF924 family)
MQLDDKAQAVLDFWFGPLDAHGQANAEHARRWFAKDEAFDHEVGERFSESYAAIAAARHEGWLEQPRGRLAYVIVLDQFSRNMFRGSPRAFDRDAQALAAAADGVARAHDRPLTLDERAFLYMPFMHSEALSMQDRSVALFSALAAEAAPPEQRDRLAAALKYAIAHREIIARFGRFPHRNKVLQRTTTRAEMEFLQQPGSDF